MSNIKALPEYQKQNSNVLESSGSPEELDIYQDEIQAYLDEFMDIHDIEPKKITSMQWAAALRYIYNHVYKHDKSCLLSRDYSKVSNTAIVYNTVACMALCNKYLDMCYTYSQRVCIEHFSFLSGISLDTLYRWRDDTSYIYIYNNSGSSEVDSFSNELGSKGLSISRSDIFKKLVQNTVISADDIMLSKSGVNSIAYRNAVQERYNSRQLETVPALDVSSLAESLGITQNLGLPESK